MYRVDLHRIVATILCLGWLLLGGAGDGGQAQAQAPKLTDVTFSLDFIVLGRHAPFYVAIDKGFYKEEGLNVNIIPAKGTAQAIQNVESGLAQIGFIDVASLVVARAEGSDRQGGVGDLPEGAVLLLLARSRRQRHQAQGSRGPDSRLEHRQLHLRTSPRR